MLLKWSYLNWRLHCNNRLRRFRWRRCDHVTLNPMWWPCQRVRRHLRNRILFIVRIISVIHFRVVVVIIVIVIVVVVQGRKAFSLLVHEFFHLFNAHVWNWLGAWLGCNLLKVTTLNEGCLKPNSRLVLTGWQITYECHQFLSISYWSNSEFWSETCIQNGNIHSIKLDVYAEKQSATKFLFYLIQDLSKSYICEHKYNI